jgi:hypothetical protein
LDLAKTDEIREIIKAHIAARGSNTIEIDERAKKQLEVSRTIPSMFPFTLFHYKIYILSASLC